MTTTDTVSSVSEIAEDTTLHTLYKIPKSYFNVYGNFLPVSYKGLPLGPLHMLLTQLILILNKCKKTAVYSNVNGDM